MLLLTAVCATGILVSALVRIRERWAAGSDARRWAALAMGIPVALFAFAVAGPLSPNWARRAGTPALLLPHSTTPTASAASASAASTGATGGEQSENGSSSATGEEQPENGSSSATGEEQPENGSSSATGEEQPENGSSSATSSPATTPTQGFSAHVVGRIQQSLGPDGATIDMHLTLASGPPSERGGTLRIRLAGRPLPGGGVALVGSEVDLVSSGSAELTGALTSLDGTHMTAQLLDATGAKLNLDANLNIDQQTGTVSGQLSASPEAA
jgi:hypothetical protein